MESWKREKTEKLELPNQEKIRTDWKKENFKYWGI